MLLWSANERQPASLGRGGDIQVMCTSVSPFLQDVDVLAHQSGRYLQRSHAVERVRETELLSGLCVCYRFRAVVSFVSLVHRWVLVCQVAYYEAQHFDTGIFGAGKTSQYFVLVVGQYLAPYAVFSHVVLVDCKPALHV